jgi:hypothetical protein
MKTQQIVTAKIGDQFLFTPNNRIFTITRANDKSVWATSPEGIEFRHSWNSWNTSLSSPRWEKI